MSIIQYAAALKAPVTTVLTISTISMVDFSPLGNCSSTFTVTKDGYLQENGLPVFTATNWVLPRRADIGNQYEVSITGNWSSGLGTSISFVDGQWYPITSDIDFTFSSNIAADGGTRDYNGTITIRKIANNSQSASGAIVVSHENTFTGGNPP